MSFTHYVRLFNQNPDEFKQLACDIPRKCSVKQLMIDFMVDWTSKPDYIGAEKTLRGLIDANIFKYPLLSHVLFEKFKLSPYIKSNSTFRLFYQILKENKLVRDTLSETCSACSDSKGFDLYYCCDWKGHFQQFLAEVEHINETQDLALWKAYLTNCAECMKNKAEHAQIHHGLPSFVKEANVVSEED